MKIECLIVHVYIIKKLHNKNKYFLNVSLDITKASKLMNGKVSMYVCILPTF